MQAIRTKFVGPTNFRGARIIATSYKFRTVVAYDHELDIDANHERAAVLHAAKAWTSPVILKAGVLPDCSRAHVIVTRNGEPV